MQAANLTLLTMLPSFATPGFKIYGKVNAPYSVSIACTARLEHALRLRTEELPVVEQLHENTITFLDVDTWYVLGKMWNNLGKTAPGILRQIGPHIQIYVAKES